MNYWNLREVTGDVKTLGDERKQPLEGLAFLGVELAVKEWRDADVIRIVVKMSIGADPEHHRRRLAQRLRRRPELRKHIPLYLSMVIIFGVFGLSFRNYSSESG